MCDLGHGEGTEGLAVQLSPAPKRGDSNALVAAFSEWCGERALTAAAGVQCKAFLYCLKVSTHSVVPALLCGYPSKLLDCQFHKHSKSSVCSESTISNQSFIVAVAAALRLLRCQVCQQQLIGDPQTFHHCLLLQNRCMSRMPND